MPASPLRFRHSGTSVKALTYGNLGAGGLSRATFEQTLPDDHPSGGFVPGFGTHTVEHRAIDPSVTGAVTVTGTRRDVTFAGNRSLGAVRLSGNTQVTANERYSRLAGAYGPVLVGNQITGSLSCTGNSAPPKDFGAPNTVRGAKTGDCARL